jgi:2-succinyl-5-enolpyruvyl-6-hydroxy-3-cyclohexene-1-carboxylate synthase
MADEDNGVLNATFCATLVDEWVRNGLTDAVVCPGSRSTPMAVALVVDGRVRVHVHHDERSGSFMALGLARATGRAVLVLSTSGTAAVEFHPAVVEAELDRVPLLVVTADRPPRLRGIGAPQTIDQVDLYGSSVRLSVDAPVPTTSNSSSWRALARRTWWATAGADPGPVHCNLPFDEPLVGNPADLPTLDDSQHTVVDLGDPFTDPGALPECGLIIAGSGIDDASAVLLLAEKLGWPVLADPRSGCRVEHRCVIAHGDTLLRSVGAQGDVEMVIRFGALPASKVIGEWVASSSFPHVHVDPTAAVNDPSRSVTHRVRQSASNYANSVSALTERADDSSWLDRWRRADDAVEEALAVSLGAATSITEPGVARNVVAAVPSGGTLVVSSSMPVRDVEWFSARREGLTVLSNRGANGIDGVVSTAAGVALSGVPTALLIGDVAFLHDTNGLLGLDARGVDLCIVVIDNDGGGIFSFLPQASALESTQFEQLFGTPHGVDLAMLAHAHGLPVLEASDDLTVGLAVEASLAAGGVHVVLARSNRSENVAVHDALHQAGIAAAAASGWTTA